MGAGSMVQGIGAIVINLKYGILTENFDVATALAAIPPTARAPRSGSGIRRQLLVAPRHCSSPTAP